jgi:hypothetical protein
MTAPRKQSAQSDAELPAQSDASASPQDKIESAQQAAESVPEAPEISLDMPSEQGERTLLAYTGDDLVVAPFGELHAGEVVAAPDYLLESLLRTGRFAHYHSDEPIDQDAIRHP